jgi:hypothetical protein
MCSASCQPFLRPTGPSSHAGRPAPAGVAQLGRTIPRCGRAGPSAQSPMLGLPRCLPSLASGTIQPALHGSAVWSAQPSWRAGTLPQDKCGWSTERNTATWRPRARKGGSTVTGWPQGAGMADADSRGVTCRVLMLGDLRAAQPEVVDGGLMEQATVVLVRSKCRALPCTRPEPVHGKASSHLRISCGPCALCYDHHSVGAHSRDRDRDHVR